MKKLLITGCARSGTGYSATIMKRLDFDFGHERKAKDGRSSWHYVNKDRSEFDIVVHQVRYPLDVIASCHLLTDLSWQRANAGDARIRLQDNILRRAMCYWLYWNQKAENISLFTYQVENLKKVLPQIFHLWQREVNDEQIESAFSVNCHVNSRKNWKNYPHSLSWSDLESEDNDLFYAIKEQAKRYGYEL